MQGVLICCRREQVDHTLSQTGHNLVAGSPSGDFHFEGVDNMIYRKTSVSGSVDFNNIEPGIHCQKLICSQIPLGRTTDLQLFLWRHRGGCGSEKRTGSGLHFDENKKSPISGNDINLTQATPVICGDDGVTPAAEGLDGNILTFSAEELSTV
jgi:hypothetical protein